MPGKRGAPERFLTTVVMTDIVGSTDHAAELGDSAWRELLQQHHALIRAELRRHGGREMDTAGDGFFVIFDAPAQAVGCVLAVGEQVRQLGLEIRAGVHVGEVQQMAGKVTGIAVVIASRIMAGGGAGDVLVSSTVRDLVAGSGLAFEDRGVRQLKGVPDEWRIYAVSRHAPQVVDSGRPTTSTELRAAAVRRAQARPIWQRRPRLVAAAGLAAALIVALAGVLVWQPWQPPALAAIAGDSVGLIDSRRGAIIATIKVGDRPGAIAVAGGSLWVTNTGSDTVSQIDLDGRSVTRIIDVGRSPIGIVSAAGSLWVANSGERTVSRINLVSGRVVDTVTVGNGPTAIAGGGDAVWVANAGDSTVVRIDTATGLTGHRIPVAAAPLAIAVDEGGVWVASADGAAVTHIDPATGVTLAAPIALSSRPVGIAMGNGSVWVASSDGSVTRIDPVGNRVTATIDTGGSLASIAATDQVVWVADRKGFMHRLTAEGTATNPPIATSSSPEALGIVSGGDVWVATRASAASHSGGTLRVVYARLPHFDPLDFPDYNASIWEADGLVGYRHVGGVTGSQLLPDLANAIPTPSDGGRTYTFQLRPDLVYSTGQRVRPQDFRRAVERSFKAENPIEASSLFRLIVGADTCDEAPAACDLSAGIETNDDANTVTFHLSEPDPEFVMKLAFSAAFPVPDGVPMDRLVEGAFPGTGPYVIASVSENEIRLVRNPHFRVYDADVRPAAYPNEIIWTSGIDPAHQAVMVERGEADWMPLRGGDRISPELFDVLRTGYAGQLHFASKSVHAVFMNTAVPPFDKLEVRQAVNLAIDRAHVADLYGGPIAVSMTCQVLPPGWFGYEPYCPYTTHPDPGGRWQAPDLDAARQLIAASGTSGSRVVVGPVFERHAPIRDYVASLMRELGYEVSVDRTGDIDGAFEEGRMAIGAYEFFSGVFRPSEFLIGFTCFAGDGLTNYCDETFDEEFLEAQALQTTDAAAAAARWAALDRRVVDLALYAPLFNEGSDFLSARVGNYQFNPSLNVLVDQLWVQ